MLGTAWPWLTLAGLGAFHGLDPAMGWLFAVALGLHRQSRRAVVLSLPPMALGHALSIGLVAAGVAATGMVIAPAILRVAAGAVLLLWAARLWLLGHRHRVRVGMTTGGVGLVVWSFLMASAHGAGLMLMPALIPLCVSGSRFGKGSVQVSLAAVGVHAVATLTVAGLIALIVYDWVGLAVLRRGWVNFDRLWMSALTATGLMLIVTSVL